MSNPLPQREAIVDKLHGALAVLRRERDELYRAKELSAERLRLVREERQAVEKNVQSMQSKLEDLTEAAAAAKDKDGHNNILSLQEEVERLGKEVKYQHSELLSKKEKLSQFQERILNDRKVRDGSLLLAKETTRNFREKNAWLQQKQEKELQQSSQGNTKILDDDLDASMKTYQNRKNSESKKRFLSEMQDTLRNNKENWISKWPRLVEEKASTIAMQAADIHRSNGSLMKRLNGYMRFVRTGQ